MLISVTFLVSHLDISGKIFKDEQTNLNKLLEFYGDNEIDEYNNTFINNISEIKKHTEKNNKDTILSYLKLLELEYNYVNLKYIFYNCSSLSSLPDISKWNIDKVIDITLLYDK